MWCLIGSRDLERYLDEGREIFLADLRERRDYEMGHICGAINFPGDSWRLRISEFPGDRLTVIMVRTAFWWQERCLRWDFRQRICMEESRDTAESISLGRGSWVFQLFAQRVNSDVFR